MHQTPPPKKLDLKVALARDSDYSIELTAPGKFSFASELFVYEGCLAVSSDFGYASVDRLIKDMGIVGECLKRKLINLTVLRSATITV